MQNASMRHVRADALRGVVEAPSRGALLAPLLSLSLLAAACGSDAADTRPADPEDGGAVPAPDAGRDGGAAVEADAGRDGGPEEPVLPPDALTAVQVLAGHEWSVVVRPDRTVWGWGAHHRTDGTVQITNLRPEDRTLRPVRLYPTALVDVEAVTGWYDGWWALVGAPGSAGARVLHWGAARHASDGRGADGAGGGGSPPQFRYNEAAPVEVLLASGGPLDRACAIAGGSARLLVIRAVDDLGAATGCAPGDAKTVWLVGVTTQFEYTSAGVAAKLVGLPRSDAAGYSPPAVVHAAPNARSYGSPYAVVLEDGRVFAFGENTYNSLGKAAPYASGWTPLEPLRAEWGAVRRIVGGSYFNTFALRADGSVWVSGYNAAGEVGRGTVATASVVEGPVPVYGEACAETPCAEVLTGVAALAANDALSTHALRDGRILGWGRGDHGLLGPTVGTGVTQPYPREVATIDGGFTAISSSHLHALAIGPGRGVHAWGSGLRGALGDGRDSGTVSAPTLVRVP